jgi:enoyl-CoA hydratase/carnithine racemase
VHGSLEHTLDQHLAIETEEIVSAAGTGDAAEGLAAFAEKRAPTFRGE